MATIDSKKLVDELIKGNGYYQDDPQVKILGEYANMEGRMVWFILYENELHRLYEYLVLPKSRVIKRFFR